MPNIAEALASIDLSQLTVHLDAAHGTVQTDIPAALASLNARALLGDLGKLFEPGALAKADPQALLGVLGGMLGELGQLAAAPVPEGFSQVTAGLQDLVAIIQKIAARLGDGAGGGSLIDRLLQGKGGLDKTIGDILGRAADILPFQLPSALSDHFGALQALAKGNLSDPREIAAILSQLLTGLKLEALQAPGAALDEFLGAIRDAGGDLGGVHAGMQQLTTRIGAVTAQLSAPDLDPTAATAALDQVGAALDLLIHDTLAVAVARLQQGLAALDPERFARRLRELLGAIPAAAPGVELDLEAELMAPLRGISALIDQLTPEGIVTLMAGVKDQLLGTADASPFGELLETIDGLFSIMVHEIEGVGLGALRDQVIDFLIGLEARVRSIPGLDAPHLFAGELAKIEQTIDGIDTAAIETRVQAFADQINAIGQKFPIGEIKNTVQGLVGGVQGALDQIKPALDALGQQLDAVGQQLGSIDFHASGQASIDLLHGIREDIQQAVGSGDVPEPAKLAIGAAAQALRALDLKAQINAPFEAVMAKVDPALVLAPIDPALGKVRQVLETVAPTAIIARLDQPFAQLLAEMEKLRPANLLAGLSADFARLTDLVGQLDPRRLVEPLEAEFQKLMQTISSAVDPAPLFAPLRALYAQLGKLFEAIDLEVLFGRMLESFGGMPLKMADQLHATAAQRSPGASAPPAAPTQVLKLGDIVRPIVAMVNQLKRLLTRAAEGALGAALDLLQAPLALLARLAQGGHRLVAAVGDELDARLGAIDVFATSGPALALREALTELQLVGGALTGDAQAKLGPLVVSLDLGVRLDPLTGPLAGLTAQVQSVRDGVALTPLLADLQKLESILGDLASTPLGGGVAGTVAQRVAGLFAFLDLEPLAQELDALGDKIQAKLLSLGSEMAQSLIDLWSALLDAILPIMPLGVVKRLRDGMNRVRAALAVLDPAPIEAEARHLVQVALSLVETFSPAHLVADLGGIVDSVRAKVGTLDPARLLGRLDPLATVIDGLQSLKPSVVLAPLLEEAKGITQALEDLTKLPLGDVLIQSAGKLKAELEVVVAGVEDELQGLLDFMATLSQGGGASASVSVG